MVVIETVTETETEVIVTGMAAAGEMTTSDRENDTTMAMAMTIQEAKEGIKPQLLLHRLCSQQQQQQQHGLLVGTCVSRTLDPSSIQLLACLSTKASGFVGGYLRLRLRLFESISSLLLFRG